MDQVERLARAFAVCLTEDIGPARVAEVVRLNAAESDTKVCHSHDFCDANMTTLRAFETTVRDHMWMEDNVQQGECSQAECDADLALWSAAWEMAVRNRFFT